MTETELTGRFRVSDSHLPFPQNGTPVTIELSRRVAQITVGEARDPERLSLQGRLDPTTRKLKGPYDDRHVFEMSLTGRGGEKSRRRLFCQISVNGDGLPNSSSWEADEDGP